MGHARTRFSTRTAAYYSAVLVLAVVGCASTPEYKVVRDADIDAHVRVVDEQGKPLKGIDVWRLVDPIPQVSTKAPPQHSLPFAYLDRVAERYQHLAEFARPWRSGFIAAVESEVRSLSPSDDEGRTGEVIKFMAGRKQTVSVKYTALGFGYHPGQVETELPAGRNRLTLSIVLRRNTDVALPTAPYWQKYLDIQREFSKPYERSPENGRTELIAAASDAERAGDRNIAARIYSWIPYLPTLTATDELHGNIRVSGYTREDEFSTRNIALLERAAALDPGNRYVRMKLLLLRPPAERDAHLRQLEALVSGGRVDLWPEVFERLEITHLAAGQTAKAKEEFEWFLAHEPSDWRNGHPFHFRPRMLRYASLDEFTRLPVDDLSRRLNSAERDAMGDAVKAGRVDLVDWSLANGALLSDLSDMMHRAISSRRPEMVRRVLAARSVAPGSITDSIRFGLQEVDRLIGRKESDLTDLAEIRRLIATQTTR